MSFRIEYRTQTLGVPKSLKGPHITRVLGTPGPHIPSDMGLPRPHITRDMGTGVPIWGGPHFTQTPVISNDVSLSGNSFPIVASHGLAGSKSGRSSLPVTDDV